MGRKIGNYLKKVFALSICFMVAVTSIGMCDVNAAKNMSKNSRGSITNKFKNGTLDYSIESKQDDEEYDDYGLKKVKKLVKHGYDVNKCFAGRTPLQIAVINKDYKFAKSLLRKGADINACSDVPRTPLYFAVINGDYKMTDLLLKKGAKVNVVDDCGFSPLYYACDDVGSGDYNESKYIRIIKLLLADQDEGSYYGSNPLLCACRNNNSNIVKLLLDYGFYVRVSEKGYSPLNCAAINGNVDMLQIILDNWKSRGRNTADIVNDVNCFGFTALYYALLSGNKEAVQLLLDNGAKVNNDKLYNIQENIELLLKS